MPGMTSETAKTIPLPPLFLSRMREQLGSEAPLFEKAMSDAPVRGIRFHPEKATADVKERTPVLRPIPWAEDAFYLSGDSPAGKTIAHEAGAFYLQEPSAMIPVSVLAPQPGEILMDLCAAPGGKSTQIAGAMAGEGLLICNEIVPQRAQILSRNIERMGVGHAVVTCEKPERLAACYPGGFDGVLADVPCSGEGMFRRDPETRAEWSPEKAAGCAQRQRAILDSAAALVRRGGRLVYSTCTFHPEENERSIRAFLRAHPDFSPVPFQLPDYREAPSVCKPTGTIHAEGFATFYPHRISGEGQFVALLHRDGDETPAITCADAPASPDGKRLLKGLLPEERMLQPLFQQGNMLFSMPILPKLQGIRTLRCGLRLAEIRDRYAVPDHAIALSGFLAQNSSGIPFRDLSSEEASRYMAGETLEGDGTGWMLMRYLGMNLGWGKGSDGLIRNHYPKGLRKTRLIP